MRSSAIEPLRAVERRRRNGLMLTVSFRARPPTHRPGHMQTQTLASSAEWSRA